MKLKKIYKKGNAFSIGVKNAFTLGLMLLIISIIAIIFSEMTSVGTFGTLSTAGNNATFTNTTCSTNYNLDCAGRDVLTNGTLSVQNFSGFTPIQGTILGIVVLLLVVGLIKFKGMGK